MAVGGDPATAVVALRGTGSTMEWWDDFHWDLVPFPQVRDGGNVAKGFCDIYDSIGTMAPGQPGASAPGAAAAEVAEAATSGPERCMLGSDLPIENLRSGFGPLYAAYDAIFSGFSEDDRAMLFGRTAERWYARGDR